GETLVKSLHGSAHPLLTDESVGCRSLQVLYKCFASVGWRDHLALLIAAPRRVAALDEVARPAPARAHAVPRGLTVQARDLRSPSTTRAAARSECRAPAAPE